ncbi:MAG: hypothetical protein RL470_1167 [Actinomycetota bacterium]
MTEPLLRIEGLQKHFATTTGGAFSKVKGTVKAVDGIDLDIYPGQTIGLVGESGCGKTTAGRTILKLYEPTGGKITFEGQDITHLKPKQMKPLRSQMQMIFQDPFASLNPRHTVGTLIGAAFEIQGITPEGGIEAEVQRLMARVGLNPEHINRYPHEFSGGQRQRIGVARAIALKPKLIVADEPVSALDVSIQAQVVNLLEDLQDEFNMAYIFVAHDLSVVQHISDRVIVMYLGKVMEEADKVDLFSHPRHPYTKALLSANPRIDQSAKSTRQILTGDIPSPLNRPSGCSFHTRCPIAVPECSTREPELRRVGAVDVACNLVL